MGISALQIIIFSLVTASFTIHDSVSCDATVPNFFFLRSVEFNELIFAVSNSNRFLWFLYYCLFCSIIITKSLQTILCRSCLYTLMRQLFK